MPTNGEMTECGEILMGEIVACTGCRPVVLLHLTNGSYGDKTPGFNPHQISKDDCVIDEAQDDQKIYRRVNPNLPPKYRACKHQIEEKTAECSAHCIDRCDPDGFNITVTWDLVYIGLASVSFLGQAIFVLLLFQQQYMLCIFLDLFLA